MLSSFISQTLAQATFQAQGSCSTQGISALRSLVLMEKLDSEWRLGGRTCGPLGCVGREEGRAGPRDGARRVQREADRVPTCLGVCAREYSRTAIFRQRFLLV